MEMRIEKIGDVTVVTLSGELDASNAQKFKRDIAPVIEANVKVIFDVSQLRFIDSSGLAALVSGLRLARAKGGIIALSGAQSQAQIVFRLTMLDRVFPIHPTYQEAEQSLK